MPFLTLERILDEKMCLSKSQHRIRGVFPPRAKVDFKRVVAPGSAIAIEGRAKSMTGSSAEEVIFERVEEAR
jgi:hypothetical protein